MKFFVTICFFLVLSNTIIAQKLIDKGSYIEYEGIEYRGERKISKLFSLNKEAFVLYRESVSSKNKSRNLRTVSIVGLTAGFIIMIRGVGGINNENNSGFVLGLLTGVVSSLVGIVSIGMNATAQEKRREAIDVFNGEPISSYRTDKKIDIGFESTKNGIGVVITF